MGAQPGGKLQHNDVGDLMLGRQIIYIASQCVVEKTVSLSLDPDSMKKRADKGTLTGTIFLCFLHFAIHHRQHRQRETPTNKKNHIHQSGNKHHLFYVLVTEGGGAGGEEPTVKCGWLA